MSINRHTYIVDIAIFRSRRDMKRSNAFILAPTQKQDVILKDIAIGCARLWNEVTYRRRSTFLAGKMNWYTNDLYNKYKSIVGSATAQQITRKNNEAWRSYFALLKMKKEGKLPAHITKVRPVGYWKERRTKKYRMVIVLRNDCYKLKNGRLQISRKLRVRIRGNPKWHGKQGRIEIHYSDNKWCVYQAVDNIQPSHKPIGNKTCYIDLGVVNLATVFVDGMKQPIAYSGKCLLNRWWADCRHIAEYQSELEKCNNKHTSQRLSRMYLKRRRRFRHAVNAMIRHMMKQLHELGVARINLGNLTGIRNNTNNHQANSMIHNFWSFDYVVRRIREVAEEYGIKVEVVSEHNTSSICPRCNSHYVQKTKRLLKCSICGLEANRDAGGVLNIASVYGGNVKRVMAHPLLSRWNFSVWRTRSFLL